MTAVQVDAQSGSVDPAARVKETTSEHLTSLQALRFIAATSVLIGHVQAETVHLGIDPTGEFKIFEPIPWGAGVDIFFVISGFIIHHISANKEPGLRSVVDFAAHRIIRIVPLYWIFSALMLVATVMFAHQLRRGQLDATHVFASFLFIPWPPSPDLTARPLLAQGWTLNYEMFFYLCFAALLALRADRRIGLLVALFVTLIAIGVVFHPKNTTLDFYSNPIIAEFVFGVVLSSLRRRTTFLPRVVVVLFVVGGIVGLHFGEQLSESLGLSRAIARGLPAALIVAAFVLPNRFSSPHSTTSRVASELGDASYSLYLSHPFVYNAIALIWKKAIPGAPYAFVIVSFFACTVASLLIYRVIERPLLAYCRSRYRERGALISSRSSRC